MNENQKTRSDLRADVARLTGERAVKMAEQDARRAAGGPDWLENGGRCDREIEALNFKIAEGTENIRLHGCAVDLEVARKVTPRREAATRSLNEAKGARHRLLLAAAQVTVTGENDPAPDFAASFASLQETISAQRAELEAVEDLHRTLAAA